MSSEIIASAAGNTGGQVASALKRAGERTGAGFDFLMKMAMRESSLNPDAKAKTSSAAGLFQFIEQTWLGAVKQYGARHGLSAFADDIIQNGSGRYAVADAARREEILNLRFNADASAALAGELANENKSFLERRLGRAASAADLYAAHFLGPVGAAKLLSAGAGLKAADLLPEAAAANRHVFYDGARKKTVGEVAASIAKSMGAEIAPAPQQALAQSHVKATDDAHRTTGDNIVQNSRGGAKADSVVISASSPLPSPFSGVALSILYALDPTRLTSSRDDNAA